MLCRKIIVVTWQQMDWVILLKMVVFVIDQRIIEVFYSINIRIRKGSSIGMGYQRIINPAYNPDRGLVSVSSIRLHTEC